MKQQRHSLPPAVKFIISQANSIKGYVRGIYMLFYHATQKFITDACTIRGNAIAYAVIISIIPLTTIFIQAAKINRGVIKTQIAAFLSAYGLSDTSELMSILDEIMARAETIAGLGFIFVLYSASNFFRHLETAFCHIYRAPRPRPLLYRFSLYISAFVVLPVVVIFTSQFIQNIRYQFESPQLQNILLRQSQTAQDPSSQKTKRVSTKGNSKNKWISASDGRLYVYQHDNNEKKVINLAEKVTSSAPYREYLIDLKNERQGQSWEVLETPTYSYQIDKHERFNIIGCLQTKKTVYAISSAGTIYSTQDEGQSWKYQQLLLNRNNEIYAPRVQDIHINSLGHIYFLIDEISYSILITRQTETYWKYQKFKNNYKRIFSIQNITPKQNRKKIRPSRNVTPNALQGQAFPFQNGLYLAGKSLLLYSNNQGQSWQGPYSEIFGERKVSIHAMQADAQGNVYFGGSNGAFWIHANTGEKSYPDIQSKSNQHIYGIAIQRNGTGLLYGSQGLLRYTSDWGRAWHVPEKNPYKKVDILAYAASSNNDFYFTASENTLFRISHLRLSNTLQQTKSQSQDDKNASKNITQYDSTGRSFVSWKLQELSATLFWESFLLNALIAPLLVIIIFIILAFLYFLVPYTQVTWRAAAVGGAFSAISITLFLSFFRLWLSGSSTTSYIYGAWAAVPLGMLIVLISTYIMLFGLELAYVNQHSYLYQWDNDKNKRNCTFWNCLYLLCLCYNSVQKRKQPLTHQTALQNFENNTNNLEISRDLLIDSDLLYYDVARSEYLPLQAATALSLNELREKLLQRTLRIPSRLLNPQLQEQLNEFMQTPQFEKQSSASSSNLTVADILPSFFAKSNEK